jgi:predicted metal-binding protein
MNADLHICTGCKDRDRDRRRAGLGGGPALLGAVAAEIGRRLPDAGIEIVAHECLGACPRRGRASIAGPGRWSWLFAGLDAEADASALCDFIGHWIATPDGLVEKAKRSASLRPKILGRVPPPRNAGPVPSAHPSTHPRGVKRP